MNKRYSVKKDVLDKHHQFDPGKTVYRIYDRLNKSYSMSYYLRKEIAEEVCLKKN